VDSSFLVQVKGIRAGGWKLLDASKIQKEYFILSGLSAKEKSHSKVPAGVCANTDLDISFFHLSRPSSLQRKETRSQDWRTYLVSCFLTIFSWIYLLLCSGR
jgi:hypothetical protein